MLEVQEAERAEHSHQRGLCRMDMPQVLPKNLRPVKYIQEHGEIERIVYRPSLNKTLKIDWLKYGAEITWATCPYGPQKVVVHHVGISEVMCQLTSEAKMRANAKEQTNHVWLKPEDFAEFVQAIAAA